jgi:hypothetical protein
MTPQGAGNYRVVNDATFASSADCDFQAEPVDRRMRTGQSETKRAFRGQAKVRAFLHGRCRMRR